MSNYASSFAIVLFAASLLLEAFASTVGLLVATIVGFVYHPRDPVLWGVLLIAMLVLFVVPVCAKEAAHWHALFAAYRAASDPRSWRRILCFSRAGWAVHAVAASVAFSYWRYYAGCSELWLANAYCAAASVSTMPAAVWGAYLALHLALGASAALLAACEVAARYLTRALGKSDAEPTEEPPAHEQLAQAIQPAYVQIPMNQPFQ